MATNNKTSALIDSLLPEFLDNEGPKFQAFVRAYYEWLETTNQVTDRSKNLLNYQDIDNTADEFLEYFRREVLSDFPNSILTNKALVYKRIKDLYRAKGTEEAYKLLFRILYDEEIDFYYPGEDILRASDGRWVQESSLRISAPFVGNPINLLAKVVVGVTSGATATVEKIDTTFESGIEVVELFVTNIIGNFLDNEQIKDQDSNVSGFLVSSVGPLNGVVVSFGGSNHQLNDAVSFISSSGINANGNIVATTDGSLSVAIANGGSGYIVGTELDFNGGGGSGSRFAVATIGDTEIIPIYTDTIDAFQNVPINTGPTFVSTGANTASVSANLASSNVSSVLSSALGISNTTVGSIDSLTIINRGSNYITEPTVSARYEPIARQNLADGFGGIKGNNATFNPSLIAGSVSEVSINNPGSGYLRSENVTIVNNSRAAANAVGAPIVSGVTEFPGAYIDTKGFLSWNNKLQDNYFYQEFSYVVRSTKAIDVYKEIAKSVVHPAGTRLFGEARLESSINFAPTISESEIDLSIENVQSIESTLSIGIPNVTYTIAPESIESTLQFGNHFVELNIDPVSIASTTILSANVEIDMFLGGFGLISIPSTVSIPSHEVLQLGDGTLTNFTANTIGDLSSEQISEYDSLLISTLPGNRIVNGLGSNFTGQLTVGSVLKVQHPLEELTLTVSSIDDANTLAITSNAVFANGDLVLFSGNSYFYT